MFFRKSLIALSLVAMTTPAIAFAGDSAPVEGTFVAETTTDGLIKMSAKAFDKGDYKKAAALSDQAIRSGLSKKRKAVAQSNLCAAHGALGNIEEAVAACDTALELRPGYGPAETNRSALNILVAQK